MGFSKEELRIIVVNGDTYLWKKITKGLIFIIACLSMHAAFQLNSNEDKKLIVNLNMAPPINYAYGEDPMSDFRTLHPISTT